MGWVRPIPNKSTVATTYCRSECDVSATTHQPGRCQHPAWRLNCGSDWVYKKRYWVGPRPAAAAVDRLSSHYLCSFLNLGSLRSSGQQGAVQWRCTVLYCTLYYTRTPGKTDGELSVGPRPPCRATTLHCTEAA